MQRRSVSYPAAKDLNHDINVAKTSSDSPRSHAHPNAAFAKVLHCGPVGGRTGCEIHQRCDPLRTHLSTGPISRGPQPQSYLISCLRRRPLEGLRCLSRIRWPSCCRESQRRSPGIASGIASAPGCLPPNYSFPSFQHLVALAYSRGCLHYFVIPYSRPIK